MEVAAAAEAVEATAAAVRDLYGGGSGSGSGGGGFVYVVEVTKGSTAQRNAIGRRSKKRLKMGKSGMRGVKKAEGGKEGKGGRKLMR